MIQIDELELSQNGKTLKVVASVKDQSYYQDILIKSLTVDTQNTFSASGPSDTPIYKASFKTKEVGTGKEVEGLKKISKEIPIDVLTDTSTNNIFYVYLEATGMPALNTPCGMDNVITLGVIYNKVPIYNVGMKYIKQVEESCAVPKSFVDYILKYKALDLAIKTENYTQANEYWKKFFENNTLTNTINVTNCGCS